MKPLVSILIPAYNAEPWVADTLKSAVNQTWPRLEIIVVNDGSRDQTLSIAQQFASKTVSIVTQENQGVCAARNKAFELCQGDYIQWLDADDLLAPDKIAKQMEAVQECQNKRTLFSSAWGYFIFRPNKAHFVPTSLWSDLTPLEWLLRKMGQNLHMNPGTWLVSRELTKAAGPWDTRLLGGEDGEYFCRVLLASNGTRFVPDAKVFYRVPGPNSLSYLGRSDRKMEAQFVSMKLHIKYIRSLEDSERVRAACLKSLQIRFIYFYPERVALVEQLEQLAATLGGHLVVPQLSWKYRWIQKLFGWSVTKRIQQHYNECKSSAIRSWDRALFRLENYTLAGSAGNSGAKSAV